MKRLLVSGLLVAAAFGMGAPATAGPGSDCSGKVDVLCRPEPCTPEHCNLTPCLVWSGSKCLTS